MLFSLYSTSGCLSFLAHKHRISISNSSPYAIPFLQPITPPPFSTGELEFWIPGSDLIRCITHLKLTVKTTTQICSFSNIQKPECDNNLLPPPPSLSFPYHQNQLELSPSYTWNQSTSLHLQKNYKLQLSLAWLLQNLLNIHPTCTLCILPFSQIYSKTRNMKGIKAIGMKKTLSQTAHCFQWKN